MAERDRSKSREYWRRHDAKNREKRRASSRERMRKYRAADPEKFRERQRKWRAANLERANEQARRSHRKSYWKNPDEARKKKREAKRRLYAANPKKFLDRQRELRRLRPEAYREYNRRSKHKKAYGISYAERGAMFEAQGRVCACCGGDDPRTKLGWHTDHCHKTGKVRGILCNNCNTTLGRVNDSPEILRKMIEYLERHSP